MLMHPHGAGFPIVNQHDQPGLAITGYGSLKFVAVKEAMIDDDGRGGPVLTSYAPILRAVQVGCAAGVGEGE